MILLQNILKRVKLIYEKNSKPRTFSKKRFNVALLFCILVLLHSLLQFPAFLLMIRWEWSFPPARITNLCKTTPTDPPRCQSVSRRIVKNFHCIFALCLQFTFSLCADCCRGINFPELDAPTNSFARVKNAFAIAKWTIKFSCGLKTGARDRTSDSLSLATVAESRIRHQRAK